MPTGKLSNTEKDGHPNTSTEEGNEPIAVSLLSIAVLGEDSLWLGERRSKAPLPPEWKQTEIYWLYPVENASLPHELEMSEWFDPTDCIFELRNGDQYSKALRLATLSTNVEAKKVRIGVRSFYFVTATEFQKAEEAYSLFLRNEAMAQESAKPVSVEKREERTKNESKEMKGSCESSMVTTLEANHEEHRTSKENHSTQKSMSNQSSGSRSAPSTLIAPSSSSGTELSGSAEAAGRRALGPANKVALWERYFIVHRGGAPILCRAFTGNAYGYKLIRVVSGGFAVFLFFIQPDSPIAAVGHEDVGVPVCESCLLAGEETVFRHRREVLVFTRVVGSRNGAAGRRKDEVEGVPPRRQPKKWAEHFSTLLEESEKVELEEEENESTEDYCIKRMAEKRRRPSTPPPSTTSARDSTRKSRGRPRKEVNKRTHSELSSSMDTVISAFGSPRQHVSRSSLAVANEEAANPSIMDEVEFENQSIKRETPPPPPPTLTTIGVNMYTDVAKASSVYAAQLTQSHPFRVASSTSQGLTTAVLPSGVCVTYTAATASKIQGQIAKLSDRYEAAGETSSDGAKGDGGSQGSGNGMISSADAMRGLLENIKLAQEQANAIS